MGVREVVVRSMLSSNLRSVPTEVRPQLSAVDNLTAFALSSGKLAQAMWHIRTTSSSDETERRKLTAIAHKELLRWAGKKFQIYRAIAEGALSYAVLERVCAQAIIEYTNPNCPTCQGIGIIKPSFQQVTHAKEYACLACNGIGTRRYSDAERLAAIGISRPLYKKTWEPRLARLMRYLSTIDMITSAQTAARVSTEEEPAPA